MTLKEQILKLRTQGKSYRKIQEELNCSKSTIGFHLNELDRQKSKDRTCRRKKEKKTFYISLRGGGCEKCGYNKCLDALEFHHLDSKNKDKKMTLIFRMTSKKIEKEIEKCTLLCANCHREEHERLDNGGKLITIGDDGND